MIGSRSILLLLLSAFLSLPAGAGVRTVFDNDQILRVADLWPADGWLDQVRVADLNNDSNPDIAILAGHLSGGRLFVYPGNGDGTFAAPLETSIAAEGPPYARSNFAIGDLDADGILDVAVASKLGTYDIRVSVRRGLGDGTFGSGPALDVTEESCWSSQPAVAVADVTADGRPDVLTCGVAVFTNLGGGSFGDPIVSNGIESKKIEVLDANGDGRMDVLLLSSLSDQPRVLLGDGDGTFHYFFLVLAEGPTTMADFDGDGLGDLARIDERAGLLEVIRAMPEGGYRSPVGVHYLPTYREAVIEAADLNADGRPDLIAGSEGLVSIALTKADGTPEEPRHYFTATSARQFAAADFDGDGAMDLVVGGGDRVGVWGAPLVVVIPGNGDGALRKADAELVIAPMGWGVRPGGLQSAELRDVTGDGLLDAITISTGRRMLMVHPGNGDGTIDAPIETVIDNWERKDRRIVWSDWDGDGHGDLAITHEAMAGFECWLSNGDGTFRKDGLVPAGLNSLREPATGDFDGDGNQDLVWQNASGQVFYPGNGDGTFAAPIAVTDMRTPRLAADMNGDGIDDLVFSTVLLLGSAARTFTTVPYGADLDIPPSVLVDLDDDGNLDLVNCEVTDPSAEVFIRLGNGDATFGPPRVLAVRGIRSLTATVPGVAGDFNADGKVDLAFGLTVLLGDGAGSFNGFARLRRFPHVKALAAGDLDGNGSSDLFFIGEYGQVLEVATTWTADSLEMPVTLAFGPTPETHPAGQELPVSATATGLGAFAPTGAAVFAVGGEVSALTEVVDGIAIAGVRHESVGAKTLTAFFGGDDLYVSGGVASVPLEVTRAEARIDGAVTPEPLTTRTVARVRGRISGAVVTPASGAVHVRSDGVLLGSGAAPQFDVEIGLLQAGTHELTLQFDGDSLYLPAEQSLTVTVVKHVPTITLTAVPPGPVDVGASVTLTASFDDASVTGQVEFRGDVALGTATIESGKASLTTNALRVGSIVIEAIYPGDSHFAAASTHIPYTVLDRPIPQSPSSLYVLTPCRVIDTRVTVGPSGGPALASAATRGVQMTGVCGIPHGAKAVALNVTVVSPAATGYLTLYPGASSPPGTSTMSYRTEKTRANNSVMSLSAGGILNVFNGGSLPAHFIIDVMGYFQ